MNSILYAVLLVSGMGLVLGTGLALANYYIRVDTDKKVEEILAVLPGANCGACSFSGCRAYAEALATGKVKTNLCTVGGSKVADRISDLLGKKKTDFEAKVAYVMCRGDSEHTQKKYIYQGVSTCKAANMLFGGDGECRFGCIGLGDCMEVCNYDSIKIEKGVAVIDQNKCVGCGMCVDVCPKHIISLTRKQTAKVFCSNTDKGAQTRKVCEVGCIGCKLCAKACEYDAISFEGGLAVIDEKKCTGCGKCEEACRISCITVI